MVNKLKNLLHNRPILIGICTLFTYGLHHIHSEFMSIIVDSGTFVSIVILALEKDK